MNHISCIIQLLEIPKVELHENLIPMVKFRAQLPYVRNKVQLPTIVESTIWGDLAYDVVNYYQVHDYALIEGYVLTMLDDIYTQLTIKITINKLYPFLFTIEK